MLFLAFQIGDQGYALAADSIVEILPMLEIKRIRGAAPEVAGLIRYRGRFVPVVDFAPPDADGTGTRMGTRIVLIDCAFEERREPIGLVVEGATETVRRDPDEFAPFALGPRGLLARLDLHRMLPPGLLADLFAAREAAA